MVCRKVCLSNAPARHPVRGRFLRASRIEANGSSRLERTPALLKPEFAQDQNGRSYRRCPRPGRVIPANNQSGSAAACGRKKTNVWVSPVRRSDGNVSAVCACETRYRFAVWDLASLAISTDLGKVWIVLASHLCACAPGAPRAASVRGAHVPAAPLLQSVLDSVSPRHFPPSLVLIPPALRVLWNWRHLRQRRDRSAAGAGGVVWGCVAAWRVCQTSKESAKMILTWILTHGFFQSLSERTIYKSSSTGQRQGGGAGCGTHRGYTRTACPGEAAPSSPAERKS